MDENLLAALAGRYALHDCPEWRSLLRLLDYTEGFAFVPVIVPDAPGAEVCRRALAEHFAAEGKSLPALPLSPVGGDELPLQPLLDFPVPADAAALWVTPDPEAWAADATRDPADPLRFEDLLWPRFAVHANQARDVIRHRLKVPLILLGTPKLVEHLRRQAPDLWSVRDSAIRIEMERAPQIGLPPLDARHLPGVDETSPLKVGNLSDTLAELVRLRRDQPDSPAVPVLLLRAARHEDDEYLWDEAAKHLSECLAYYKKHGGHPEQIWECERFLANTLEKGGRSKEAEVHAVKALEIANESFARDTWRPGYSHHLLARTLESQGRLSEAEDNIRSEVAFYRDRSDLMKTNVATALSGLGEILERQGRFSEAEAAYRESVEIATKHSWGHDSLLIGPLKSFARFLEGQRQFDEAESILRRVLEISTLEKGMDDPAVAWDLLALAGVLDEQGKFVESKHLFDAALEIMRRVLGGDHPRYAMALENFAVSLRSQGRLEESANLLRQSQQIIKARLGRDHPFVGHSMLNFARTLRELGRVEEAKESYLEMLRVFYLNLGSGGSAYPFLDAAYREFTDFLHSLNLSEDQIGRELERALVESPSTGPS